MAMYRSTYFAGAIRATVDYNPAEFEGQMVVLNRDVRHSIRSFRYDCIPALHFRVKMRSFLELPLRGRLSPARQPDRFGL